METLSGVGSSGGLMKPLAQRATDLIKEKDTDGNKVLSPEELGVSEDVFTRTDRNGDNQVDKYELVQQMMINRKISQFMQTKDTNGDKVLSPEELAISEEKFNQLDRNSDGQVQIGELRQAIGSGRIYKPISILEGGGPQEATKSVDVTA